MTRERHVHSTTGGFFTDDAPDWAVEDSGCPKCIEFNDIADALLEACEHALHALEVDGSLENLSNVVRPKLLAAIALTKGETK